MSYISHTLLERSGSIHETLGFDEFWVQGSYEEGMRVDDDSVTVEHILLEACFVLPKLPGDEPGRYPVLTVGTGWPGETPDEPLFRVPSGQRAKPSGTLLHMTYEPSASSFHFSMNAGTTRAELQTVTLEGASPEKYTGRVLRAFVLITRTGMYPSIEDPFTGREELFGELVLAHRSRVHIWGSPPTGHWWILSGAENDQDEEERSSPAGFGLSDLRLTLTDMDQPFQMLPYSGELDHLVIDNWDDVNPFGPDDRGEAEPMSEILLDLADQLDVLSGGVSTLARRAGGLAEETKGLALRLPEAQEESEAYDF